MKPCIVSFLALLFVTYNAVAQQPMTDSVKRSIVAEMCKRSGNNYVVVGNNTISIKNDSFSVFLDQNRIRLEESFAWLLAVTAQYGFPTAATLKTNDTLTDTDCKPGNIMPVLTLIQGISHQPLRIFTDTMVAVLKREIDARRISPENISRPLEMAAGQRKLCANDRARINASLILWGINPLPPSQFFLCE